jgi:hypothetical protein
MLERQKERRREKGYTESRKEKRSMEIQNK